MPNFANMTTGACATPWSAKYWPAHDLGDYRPTLRTVERGDLIKADDLNARVATRAITGADGSVDFELLQRRLPIWP